MIHPGCNAVELVAKDTETLVTFVNVVMKIRCHKK